MRLILCTVLSLLFVPLTGLADNDKEPKEKKATPWLWSSDERIRVRFDPNSAKERKGRVSNKMRKAPTDSHVIEGKHDPELFFPWELMDGFLQRIDVPPSRAAQARESFRQAIEGRGWSYDNFWREVDSATAVYISTKKQQIEHRFQLAQSRKQQGVPVNGGISPYLVEEVCRERASALDKVRQGLGKEQFDTFLYTAIAPSTTLWITADRDATLLNRIERGCR